MEIDINDLAHFDSIGTERETIEFLIAMLLYFQPAVIVEAGTYKGHFAVPAARLAQAWGGVVWTFDPNDFFWRDKLTEMPTNLHYMWEDFNLSKYGLQPNFAFIDSGPPFGNDPDLADGTVRQRHYEHAKEHCAHGAIICTHDTIGHEKWLGGSAIRNDASILFEKVGRGLAVRQI